MPDAVKSLQIAFRSLRRRPLLALVALVTLGLGTGASTAIYTVLQATLLSPPPYSHPDQLVTVWGVLPTRQIDSFPFSPPEVEIFRNESRLFQDVAGYLGNNHVLRIEGGNPEPVSSMMQSWNLFQLLGVGPMLGRDFTEEDAEFNQSEVPPGVLPPNNIFNPARSIILSHDFWARRFGADPAAVGQKVYLDELPVTIVGVMPPAFKFLLPGAPVTPEIIEASRFDVQNAPLSNVFLTVVGRMQPEISIEQAAAEIGAVGTQIAEAEPILKASQFSIRLVPLREEMTRDISTVIWVLAGAVGFILLIACANVSNLLLVRSTDRRSEQFIRIALGSSRLRLVGESLVETGLLAFGGALLGILVAYISLPLLVSLQPQNIPQLVGLEIDTSVLFFAAVTAILVTLLAGSLPALTAAGQRANEFNPTVRGASRENRSGARSRSILIVGEVALSFVLLIGAGLMTRSFYSLQTMDPGFDPRGVVTFNYAFPANRFPGAGSQLDFHRQFEQRVAALPGVVAVGGIFPLPLSGQNMGSRYSADLTSFTDGSARQAQYRSVYPGYFDAVRAPLVRGRTFTYDDQRSGARYAVVNEALVDRTWKNEDPLGKRLYIRGATPDPVELEVIGVVRNQAQQALNEQSMEAVYVTNRVFSDIGFGTGISWTVRVQGDPRHSASAIAEVLHELDREMPLQFVDTLPEIVAQSAAPTRFAMTLIGIFSALATFLAAIGLYGVLAYRVRQQRPELGIRLTFGATRGGIFALVLRNGLLLAGGGLAIGLVAALLLTRAMTSLLIGITPADPATYLSIAVLFGVIAAVSCLLPAFRATRVDPAQVLRQQ